MIRQNKGQSTLEYAVVIAVVVAALVWMGWGWFRGSYQKKIMSAGDEISGGGQFDVNLTNALSTVTRQSNSTENINSLGSTAIFNTTQNEQSTVTATANTEGLSGRHTH